MANEFYKGRFVVSKPEHDADHGRWNATVVLLWRDRQGSHMHRMDRLTNASFDIAAGFTLAHLWIDKRL